MNSKVSSKISASTRASGNNALSEASFFPDEGAVGQQESSAREFRRIGARAQEDKARAAKIQNLAHANSEDRQQLHANIEWFESTIKELITLSKRQPLRDKDDVARVKELMRDLRRMGHSSKDIEQLTSGAWREPTIKQYTQGVKVTDSEVKDNMARILVRAINSDTGMNDLAEIVDTKASLAERGIGLEKVISLAKLVQEFAKDSSQLDIEDVVQTVATMKDVGITPDGFQKALPCVMAIAEQEGGELDPDAFEQLAQASKRFDGLANTLKALEAFDNIQDLLEKVGETKEEFEQIKDQLSDHNKQLKHAQATLDLFKDLQSKGYDTDFLDMFRQFVTRYSKNSRMPAAVLEQIVNKISSLEELVAAERQALAKAAEAENRRKTKEIEHAALAKSIEFANLLLFKHKFSPETIDRLVKQTQVYGGIDGFLTALENFRRIEDLRDTEQTLKANLSRLRGEEKGLINSAQRLRGQAEDAANSLQSLVSSAITNIKRQLEESIQRISDETRQEISVIKQESKWTRR